MHFDQPKRRKFISVLGGAAASLALPRPPGAQQAALPVVGFLRSESLADAANIVSAFRQGLQQAGFAEAQNVTVEWRSAEGHREELPALAAELVRRPVGVLVGNTDAALAAKALTTTMTGFDPVREGLVSSLNRPGGNVTGIAFIGGSLGPKRLELLRQAVPKATTVGVLFYPDTPGSASDRANIQAAGDALRLQTVIAEVRSPGDIDAAFAAFVKSNVGAVLVGPSASFYSNRQQIVLLATRHGLPTCFDLRVAVQAGALMSYAPNILDAYRQAGAYAARILRGEKPADLPVMQSSTFELVINLRTARALGLELPPTLLALADEVIE